MQRLRGSHWAALAALAGVVAGVCAQELQPPWPMYGQGEAHGRWCRVSPPLPTNAVGWRTKVSASGGAGWVYGAPCVGADEAVYTSSWDGAVAAIWPNGTVRWRFVVRQGEKLWGSPALGFHPGGGGGGGGGVWGDVVYVGGNASLLAIAAPGATSAPPTLAWAVPLGAVVFASPTVDSTTGAVFIGGLDGTFWAVSGAAGNGAAAGAVLWKHSCKGMYARLEQATY